MSPSSLSSIVRSAIAGSSSCSAAGGSGRRSSSVSGCDGGVGCIPRRSRAVRRCWSSARSSGTPLRRTRGGCWRSSPRASNGRRWPSSIATCGSSSSSPASCRGWRSSSHELLPGSELNQRHADFQYRAWRVQAPGFVWFFPELGAELSRRQVRASRSDDDAGRAGNGCGGW